MSSSSTTSVRVISDSALQILRARGDDAPLRNGVRAVSNTSYLSESSIESKETVMIPEASESLETLVFVEFTPEIAQKIRDWYQQDLWLMPWKTGVVNYGEKHILSFDDNPSCHETDEQRYQVMDNMGILKGYQKRLMTEEFRQLRLTGTVQEWFMDTMHARWEFLKSLDDVLADTLPVGTFRRPEPSAATEIEEPPREVEGHTIFFKGATMARFGQFLKDDGTLNFSALGSTPPEDFDYFVRGLYLTKMCAVAWEYAQFARKRYQEHVVPVGILQVTIPKPLMDSHYELFGNDWQRLVWHNRRMDGSLQEMEHLETVDWIIGPLCMQSNAHVQELNDLSEIETWRLESGECATQVYTGSRGMLAKLNKECVGKVWIAPVV
ncbi:MAG: hypothetical protein M1819_002281 [Sarea resinae]|nr:MAG: hypothetical protein M1819_002281 [Sarea resinae]